MFIYNKKTVFLKKILFFSLICIQFGCQTKVSLDNFNIDVWKNDKFGCKNLRLVEVKSLIAQKEKIKGLGQNQIIQLLGKPDFQELYARNQRFYIYFYQKNETCDQPNNVIKTAPIQNQKTIKLRFSALDMVTEVLVDN